MRLRAGLAAARALLPGALLLGPGCAPAPDRVPAPEVIVGYTVTEDTLEGNVQAAAEAACARLGRRAEYQYSDLGLGQGGGEAHFLCLAPGE